MNKSKSTLFLMELIIVILFFALSSAVCLRIFVHAHQLERATENINYAVLWGGNAAELFYEYDNPDDVEKTLMDAYNSAVNYSDEYGISLSFREDSSFAYMTYLFTEKADGRVIYEFTFQKHLQEVVE